MRKNNLFILKMKLNETNLRINNWQLNKKEMWMKLCIQILLNSWSLWWYTICSKWTRLWMIYKSIYFRLSISSYVLFSFSRNSGPRFHKTVRETDFNKVINKLLKKSWNTNERSMGQIIWLNAKCWCIIRCLIRNIMNTFDW